MRWPTVLTVGRLAVAWGTVAVFIVFGPAWLAAPSASIGTAVLFVWLLAVVSWCAFGVVGEADGLAELLGEPLGTLILTISVVGIEVALMAAVMLGAHDAPTLGRDTMFALLMIVLNGVVGLALLLGGLRHREQDYNLQGAVAYLAVIVPLSIFALVLPNFTRSTPGPTLSTVQGVFFALFTTLLYGVFLGIQTVRHRGFFVEAPRAATLARRDAGIAEHRPAAPGEVARHAGLLLVTMLPIVLLAKQLARLVDHGIAVLGAPSALGGVLIAVIVLAPEGVSALRAAARQSAAARGEPLSRRRALDDRSHGARRGRHRPAHRSARRPRRRPDEHGAARGDPRGQPADVQRLADDRSRRRGPPRAVPRLPRAAAQSLSACRGGIAAICSGDSSGQRMPRGLGRRRRVRMVRSGVTIRSTGTSWAVIGIGAATTCRS